MYSYRNSYSYNRGHVYCVIPTSTMSCEPEMTRPSPAARCGTSFERGHYCRRSAELVRSPEVARRLAHVNRQSEVREIESSSAESALLCCSSAYSRGHLHLISVRCAHSSPANSFCSSIKLAVHQWFHITSKMIIGLHIINTQ